MEKNEISTEFCSICLSSKYEEKISNNLDDINSQIRFTNCNHMFHVGCIKQNQLLNNICPICRQNIEFFNSAKTPKPIEPQKKTINLVFTMNIVAAVDLSELIDFLDQNEELHIEHVQRKIDTLKNIKDSYDRNCTRFAENITASFELKKSIEINQIMIKESINKNYYKERIKKTNDMMKERIRKLYKKTILKYKKTKSWRNYYKKKYIGLFKSFFNILKTIDKFK